MNKRFGLVVFVSGAMLSSVVLAEPPPPDNVSGKRHPNLAHAQKAIDKAFSDLSAAQQANEFDMNGHAAKAKELLEQADTEIKQAAGAANHAHK